MPASGAKVCLRRKAVPLALAIALLGVSVWRVATMGIVMIPDMSSNQLTITVNVPDDTAKEVPGGSPGF